MILDGRGEPLGRFVPEPDDEQGHWSHFLSDEGRELRLLDASRKRVYRYDFSMMK